MKGPETKFIDQLVESGKRQGILVLKWRDKYVAGMPDLIITGYIQERENTEDGGDAEVLVFAECKFRGTPLTPLQLSALCLLAKHWGHVYVFRYYPSTPKRHRLPRCKVYSVEDGRLEPAGEIEWEEALKPRGWGLRQWLRRA